jgi:two-component system, chemotaxis family, sensor kinase CheA
MLLKDKRIFIVEDNLQNRIVFQMSMVNNGAMAYFERRGLDALPRLQTLSNVSLIILDLMLAEGVSGFDIFKEIRALPAYTTIPIVAVSAMDAAVALPKAHAMGFNGFIAKPINAHLFPRQLLDILAGKAIWHTGERALS